MNNWSKALSYAPFVVGLMACSSDDGPATTAQDASAGSPTMDGMVAQMDAAADMPDRGFLDTGPADSGVPSCNYPADAAEPMALNQVLSPYTWSSAFTAAGQLIDLNLTDAFCNTDPDIDWSPFDLLLFVSIPAW